MSPTTFVTMEVSESDSLLDSRQSRLQNYCNSAPPRALPPQVEGERPKKLLVRIIECTTVEPVMLVYIIAWMMEFLFSTQIMLDKVCEIHYEFPPHICKNMTYYRKEKEAVQGLSANYIMLKNLLSNIPAVFFVLLLGSWSDRNGRKVPMLLPVVGSSIAIFVDLINAYLWWLPPEFLILGGIPKALSGGVITLLMVCYAYLADITTVRSRTMRMALLNFIMYIGPPFGLYIRNPLSAAVDYVGIFWISAGLYLLCSIYIFVRIPNVPPPQTDDSQSPLQDSDSKHRRDTRDDGRSSLSYKYLIKETVNVLLKPREGDKRFNLVCLTVNLCLLTFLFGTDSLEYLFTMVKFHWSYISCSYFAASTVIIASLGSTLLLPLLSYKIGIDDVILGAFGCTLRVLGFGLEAFISEPALLYVASTVSFLGILPMIVTRSAISKEVPPDELGKVFSMVAAWQAIMPLLAGPAYTILYNDTLHVSPGAILLFSAAASAAAAIIFLSMLVNRWSPGTYTSIVPT